MEKYYYTKFVQATPLRDIIMMGVDKSLWRKIEQLNVKSYIDEAHLEDDNIEIATNEVLTSDELDQIAAAINSYSPTHELVVRYGIELNTMNPATSFGSVMVQKFASNNLYRQKTGTQVNALLSNNLLLILALLTGSLTTAYGVFAAMPADENISQAEIDEFKKRLELYLGI